MNENLCTSNTRESVPPESDPRLVSWAYGPPPSKREELLVTLGLIVGIPAVVVGAVVIAEVFG